MTKVALIQDPFFHRHETGGHPEQPARLVAIEEQLRSSGLLEGVMLLEPEAAQNEDILRAHDKHVIDRVKELSEKGGGNLDSDTIVSGVSAEVAGRAAGGLITVVREIMEGSFSRGVCLVRPPGHHARRSKSMGFCLYNNVAVASYFLLTQYAVERIAIIDFDVHHGNGTQDIFYNDPQVFFFRSINILSIP